jgi:legumain
MKSIILLTLLALSLTNMLKSSNLNQQHYAVLIAGSNGFWNYRHQADIYHAYHILINNGMPKENIIVFAYDDIAYDQNNAYPGKVFNKPDPYGLGHDVYQGVPIDYKGVDITPQIFLDVLEGNADKVKGKGTGRVLTSTANDHVFINFSDHGGPGLIAFPDNGSVSQILYADALMSTLKEMHEKNMYKQMVFYLEACESGSMFNGLLTSELNIYATTASNSTESSYGTYCDPYDDINGVNIMTCLGDLYSVNWMENSETNNGLTESLATQFAIVKDKTAKSSHVMEFGDLSFDKEDIGQFQGNHGTGFNGTIQRLFNRLMNYFTAPNNDAYELYIEQAKESKVDSRYAKLKYLEAKMKKTNTFEANEDYVNELRNINRIDVIFSAFKDAFLLDPNFKALPRDFDCLRAAIKTYSDQCRWGEYELKYAKSLVHACEKGVHVDDMTAFFEKICK